jgi:hypothetical protein
MPWSQHATVAEFPRLIKDLPDEFPRGTEDKHKRLSLVAALHPGFRTGGLEFERLPEQFREDRNKEGGGFAGS